MNLMLSITPLHVNLLPTNSLILSRPSPLQKVSPLVEVSFGDPAETPKDRQGVLSYLSYDWTGYLSEPVRKGVFIDVYG